MRTEVTKSSKTRLWVGIVLHAPTSWGWGAIFNSWVQHYFEFLGEQGSCICRVSNLILFYTCVLVLWQKEKLIRKSLIHSYVETHAMVK